MNDVFNWCVWLLEVTAPMVGMTYQEINIWLFVIIQPALIVLFFVLWLQARKKTTHNQHSQQTEV